VSGEHTVLLARVPAADAVVAVFGELVPPEWEGAPYAHVTALGPFAPRSSLTPARLDAIGELVRSHLPVTVDLVRLERFAEGMVWLAPEDPKPFRALTEGLWREFPDYPPYGGQFDEVIPHLSLGRLPFDVDFESIGPVIEPLLPVRTVVDTVQLVVWSTERVDVLHEWVVDAP
jgi:hypothetical protein